MWESQYCTSSHADHIFNQTQWNTGGLTLYGQGNLVTWSSNKTACISAFGRGIVRTSECVPGGYLQNFNNQTEQSWYLSWIYSCQFKQPLGNVSNSIRHGCLFQEHRFHQSTAHCHFLPSQSSPKSPSLPDKAEGSNINQSAETEVVLPTCVGSLLLAQNTGRF